MCTLVQVQAGHAAHPQGSPVQKNPSFREGQFSSIFSACCGALTLFAPHGVARGRRGSWTFTSGSRPSHSCLPCPARSPSPSSLPYLSPPRPRSSLVEGGAHGPPQVDQGAQPTDASPALPSLLLPTPSPAYPLPERGVYHVGILHGGSEALLTMGRSTKPRYSRGGHGWTVGHKVQGHQAEERSS